MPEAYIADPQRETQYVADMVAAYKSVVFGLTTREAAQIVAQETGKSYREVLAAVRRHGLDD